MGAKWRGVRRFSRRTPHRRYQPACKPGSVGHHLARARRYVTAIPLGWRLRATSSNLPGRRNLTPVLRRFRFREQPAHAVPIRSCSRWGLPCRFRCRTRGALLPHLFTLAAGFLSELGAVRFLWHFPWGRPRRTLSGTACRWSPDFPPPLAFRRLRKRPSGRLTPCLWAFMSEASRAAKAFDWDQNKLS